MAELGRILTAMVTPYTAEGAVDFAHARRLAAHLVRCGNDGVVVTGTTGEAPLLSDDEAAGLWDQTKQALGDGATVVAGAGTNDTRHSVALTARAERAGVDAVLAVVPYYLRPSQEGIYRHFRAIAESTPLPVIVYDVPIRVGTGMTVETVLRVAELPNVVGIKAANGDLAHSARILAGAPGFRIWSGNDDDTFHLWCLGGWGVISVTGHLVAGQLRRMLDHLQAGALPAAAAIHRSLVPVTAACFRNGSPSTIRYVLRQRGIALGAPRLPVVEPDDAVGAEVMAALRGCPLDPLPDPAR
ncbi:MAG: 4-hydroxy-tetrahydrodipicolinate synthase [Myxococcota bacterium]